jgi:hypothetical protein
LNSAILKVSPTDGYGADRAGGRLRDKDRGRRTGNARDAVPAGTLTPERKLPTARPTSEDKPVHVCVALPVAVKVRD